MPHRDDDDENYMQAGMSHMPRERQCAMCNIPAVRVANPTAMTATAAGSLCMHGLARPMACSATATRPCKRQGEEDAGIIKP